MSTKKATPVSRSVYQKLKEDHKRLLADLKAICYNALSVEAIQARKKWREYFEERAQFETQMKRIANQARLATERKLKKKKR